VLTRAFRAIYRFWVSLIAIAVVIQIGLAGYGAFDTRDNVQGGGTVDEDSYDDSFGPHIGLGYLIMFSALILLLLSFGARGKQRILRSVAAFVLIFIQIMLGESGAAAPYALGALHPVNAFIILGLLGSIVYREWTVERRATREPAVASPPA
jgi:heme A synthase